MILSLLPAMAFAETQKIGESNTTWELTNDNTVLTIGGTGAMPDFRDSNPTPWVSQKGKIHTVCIESGVTSIGSAAFQDCSNLTEVNIPESVTSIGNSAFYNCSALTQVTIPESVTSIGNAAFMECTNLATISFDGTPMLKSIGNQAFIKTRLTSVIIPAKVTEIGTQVFDRCASLQSIDVDINNAKYVSDGGVLFNKEKSTLICYPSAKEGTKYTIPDTVIFIGDSAFRQCENLVKVEIPSTVTSIGSSAFNACTSLSEVKIPSSVTEIKNMAFYGCSGLESVISLAVTPPTLSSNVFNKCDKLNLIAVPEESVNAYNTATNWSAYADKIKGEHIVDGITFEAWTAADSLPTIAGSYYLTTDVAISGTWNVPTSVTPTNLDLNGHVIKIINDDRVINISNNTTLNLYDCGETEHAGYVDASGLWHWDATGTYVCKDGEIARSIIGGVITGSKASGIGIDQGVFNMYGGSIVGNTTGYNGGGVIVSNGANFNMFGGIIKYCTTTGNESGLGMGGGVYVADNQNNTFNIDGGIIQDCFAQRWGGGVANQGTMTVTKGAILSCSAINGAGGVNNDRIFNMYGGTIENCKAIGGGSENRCEGAGIRVANGKDNAKVTIGGDAKIINNTNRDGTASNLYLEQGKEIFLADGVNAPKDGMSVGVTAKSTPVASVPVVFMAECAEKYAAYFTSDNSDYDVMLNSGGLALTSEYLLWIGDTRVDINNKNDILGDADGTDTTVVYNNATHTLTLSGASITGSGATGYKAFDDESSKSHNGIKSGLLGVTTVKLVGSNRIGADNNCSYGMSDFTVDSGVFCKNDLVITGDGSLTVYDYCDGVVANNVTFDEGFTGILNVTDCGNSIVPGPPVCAIRSAIVPVWNPEIEQHEDEGGNTVIKNGTFKLSSYMSDGIYAANNLSIENANIDITAASNPQQRDKVYGIYGNNVNIKNAEISITAGAADVDNDVIIYGIYAVNKLALIDTELEVALLGKVDGSNNDLYGLYSKNRISISGDKSEIKVSAMGDAGFGILAGGDENSGQISISGGKSMFYGSSLAICSSSLEEQAVLTIGSDSKPMEIKNAVSMTFDGLSFSPGEAVTEGRGNLSNELIIPQEPPITMYYAALSVANDAVDDGYITILPKQPTPPAPVYYGGDDTTTVTVPVSGDEKSVNVSVTVSGSTATVKRISDADLEKVTEGESVAIDLSSVGKNVDTAKIPTETVEKIAEKSSMTVKLPVATVEFDKAATEEIVDQAKGSNIELVVDDIKEVSLNAVQKEAVKKLDTAIIIDAHLVSNGSRLCTENEGGFGGGKAKVVLPYEIKNNRKPENYNVFYVDEAGNRQKLNATYDEGLKAFVFEIEHFSVYAVAFDQFVDIDANAYYYDAVKWAAANGVTDGVDETHFNPTGITNRAQMVTFLWKVAGKPEPTITETPFTDIDPDWYYYKAVLWAYENGITDGTSETTFEPSKNVSRAQVVTFLWRYAGKPVVDYWMQMTDVESEMYYTEAVRWALAEKITDGTTTTTFSPNDDCLRGQIVTFLFRDFAK